MLSVGLDLHKRYSQVEAVEENGERRSGARLVNEFEQIEGFFRSLGEPCRVVLEAGWNWGSMAGLRGDGADGLEVAGCEAPGQWRV